MIGRLGVIKRGLRPCLSRKYTRSSLPHSLTDMVIGFLKNESKVLQTAMDRPLSQDKSMLKIPIMKLDSDIQQPLLKAVDCYSQLRVLLTYHPIRIEPQLYMMVYNRLEDGLTRDEQIQLIKCLIYHRLFEDMWKVVLSSGATTLNDIEDFVDIIYSQLKDINYIEIGLMQVLETTSTISSESIKNTILETTIQKFKINKEKYPKIYREMIAKRQFFQQTKDEKILQDERFCQLPGYISFILNDKGIIESNKPYVETRVQLNHNHIKETNLNVFDIIALINHSPANYKHLVYRFLAGTNIKQKEIIDHILLFMIKNDPNIDNIVECITKFIPTQSISEELLAFSIVHIFLHSKPHFENFIDKVNVEIYLDTLLTNLKKTQSTETISQQLVYLITKINESGKLTRKILRKILRLLSPNIITKFPNNFQIPISTTNQLEQDDILNLLNIPLSNSNFLEIVYFILVKNQLTNEIYINPLLNKLLYSAWDIGDDINKRGNLKNRDFQEMYARASPEDKSKLTKCLKCLGKAISQLETSKKIQVFNTLHKYIFSQNFTFTKSEYGKNYLIEKILKFTMEEMFEQSSTTNKSNKQSINEMKDILLGINFDSVTCQAMIYQFMVLYDPNLSIQLIITYKDTKAFLTNTMMENIMLGIFKNPKLSNQDKLMIYRRFRDKLMELGYNSRIHSNTIYYLFKILIEMTEYERDINIDIIHYALKTAKKSRIPSDKINEWVRKLRIV